MDSSHHVVDDRPDGNHLPDRIDVLVLETQFPDERKLLVDQLFSEMADVQVDVVAVRAR